VTLELTVNQFNTKTFIDQLAQNTVTNKPKKIPRTKNLPPARTDKALFDEIQNGKSKTMQWEIKNGASENNHSGIDLEVLPTLVRRLKHRHSALR